MTYHDILLEHRGAVSWLYLNRPSILNAIGPATMNELREALGLLRERAETRVIILSGKGRAFCAGGDIADQSNLDRATTFLDRAIQMEAALIESPKPIIAAINGLCCGGGLELALMCDFIIAAESAQIGDAHANIGLIPGGGATVRLPRLIGPNWTKLLVFSGQLFPASKMAEIGLVQLVSEDLKLEAEAQALGESIATKSPLAIARAKIMIQNSYDLDTETALMAEKRAAQSHIQSEDATEGVQAFAQKRKPNFKGL